MTTPACQLYLVMPVETPQAADKLARMLAGGHVASLLLTAAPGAEVDPAKARPLVKLAQGKGVAVLMADDSDMARKVGADGVHLIDDPFDYDAARRALGPRAIVGVDVGLSRHDAMELGERGADYVAFNDRGDDMDDAAGVDHDDDGDDGDDNGDSDAEPSAGGPIDDEVGRALPDRVGWWAELFTVPCVAWDVMTPEEAAEIAHAGADFVAIAPEAWEKAADPAVVVDAFAEAITRGGSSRGSETRAGA